MDVNNFAAIRISLASPEKIREWSHGEVKKPETLNYRTLKPERDGLFCERIFGPTKDWECYCGKYKRIRYRGVVCDKCGVEVTRAKVRRERMGHIELATPVSHIWYFKGVPSRMGLLLDMSPRVLERILYFAAYVVTDPGDCEGLSYKQVLTEAEYREAREKYGNRFRAGMGAEAVKELLTAIDLDKLAQELREEAKNSTGQRKVRAIRRLEVVEAFRKSGNRPEWMILDVIPVIPPDLRPMVQLDGGRFATSDLNDLYRRVINRNNRLKRLLDLGAPDIIVRNEKRMLQEAVDALIDNGRRGRPVTGPGQRPLKSLSDMLKGKQGRFRQNLLGKRVDYSGRSVIVVGPNLKFHQCGLPKEMALELFKPFVMKRLVEKGEAHNIKSARRLVERARPEVWDVLEEVIKEHPVLLNRAPTLHRLSIQAFEPVLVEGRAIQIHPLVCPPYNADFDGDQMPVHVPLSAEAQAEARILMASIHNLLLPKDGSPAITPTKDVVLGIYYLTLEDDRTPLENGHLKAFASMDEAILAYETGNIKLHQKIELRLSQGDRTERITTTVGRCIFNQVLPEGLRFVNEVVDRKRLGKLVALSIRRYGMELTAQMLDGIKDLGFFYATKAGSTISIDDIVVPKEKPEILREAEAKVQEIQEQYQMGFLTEDERYNKVIEVWRDATDRVTKALQDSIDKWNPVYMMAISGARGNMQQISQLGGMRGIMVDPSGRMVEQPVRSNFREGLTVLEYFTSTHGQRKGLVDTALRTADSGYLTRRLVDVAQDVIVREEDCGTENGIIVRKIEIDGELIETLYDRIVGRFAAKDVIDPNTHEVICRAQEMIDEDKAEAIEKAGITEVEVRSVLTCETRHGVCVKCYGRNLATGQVVDVGEAVGIIAAQSIGEPGTQLTLRTFHLGGIAGEDITQGLPRVEELFEARKPKGQAAIAEIGGTVEIVEGDKKREIRITSPEGEVSTIVVPLGALIKVTSGQKVEPGDVLTEGSINPHDLLRVKNVRAVEDYLLSEVQRVYRLQGIDISDKHIEIIIRQMMRKIKVEEPGDTDLLPGGIVDIHEFADANAKVFEKGGEPATGKPVILGITKASLATDSFLSAASFQETTRVLTEAAVRGKVDHLLGLKENVIIGKLIPAGTGMQRYNQIEVVADTEAGSQESEVASGDGSFPSDGK
ncbi:MAG TPA: DNA-directed RNA polymerase subunit beta' [Firmicutes bacterium]|nr:DNA-directed RNA polymerase subunit beta' [Candidatus Fermentithermobacillaceae bacterium]